MGYSHGLRLVIQARDEDSERELRALGKLLRFALL